MTSTVDMTPAYSDQFAALRASLPGAGLTWMRALRERGMALFAGDGFPTPRVEEWKYLNLAPLARTRFVPAGAVDFIDQTTVARFGLGETPAHRVVLVNGRFRADLSALGRLPAGARIDSLARLLAEAPALLEPHLLDPGALAEDRLSGARDTRPHALTALNSALAADGVVIYVPKGAAIDMPVHILSLTHGGDDAPMSHPRHLLIAGEGASATVIESVVGLGQGARWTNAVTQVVAAAGAELGHYRLQADADQAFHSAATYAVLARGARYRNFVLSTGASLSRNEIRVRIDGPDVACTLDGAYLARGDQAMDNFLRVDHAAPRGTTTELYKGVIDERAHGSFQGRIRIWPHAIKSNARQTNHNLLLADGAAADSKPELEILNDDVQCSHGSTVGDLDRDALFYLRARGIGETDARALLIHGFIGSLIDSLPDQAARGLFGAALGRWLAAAGGAELAA